MCSPLSPLGAAVHLYSSERSEWMSPSRGITKRALREDLRSLHGFGRARDAKRLREGDSAVEPERDAALLPQQHLPRELGLAERELGGMRRVDPDAGLPRYADVADARVVVELLLEVRPAGRHLEETDADRLPPGGDAPESGGAQLVGRPEALREIQAAAEAPCCGRAARGPAGQGGAA